MKLSDFLEEVSEKTTQNNQYSVLTSSKNGIFPQDNYFNKQVASKDNTGYKVIRRGEFTYRAMSDTGEFYPNMLECTDIGIVSPAYPVFRISKDVIIPEYLKYYFKSKGFQKSITSFVQGSTRASMKFGKMKTISIDLPDKETQLELTKKLNLIRVQIKIKTKELSLLDTLIKARFVEMFGDQSSNPFSWKKEAIGNCCKLKSGISLDHSIENEGGPIPYVKVGDMNFPGNEEYITTSSRFVSKETAHKGLFSVGSVIFPKRGGAIGTNKKRLTKVPICADLNVMGVSSDGSILPEYLFVYFEMIDLASLSDGSSVPQINNKDIAPLEICIPPIDLQKNFASFVSQVDKSKFAVQKLLVASKNVLQLIKEDLNE